MCACYLPPFGSHAWCLRRGLAQEAPGTRSGDTEQAQDCGPSSYWEETGGWWERSQALAAGQRQPGIQAPAPAPGKWDSRTLQIPAFSKIPLLALQQDGHVAVGVQNQPRTHVATGTHKDFGSKGVTGSPATLCQQRSVRLSRARTGFIDTQGYTPIKRVQILPPFLRSNVSRPRATASVLSSPRLPRSLRPPGHG